MSIDTMNECHDLGIGERHFPRACTPGRVGQGKCKWYEKGRPHATSYPPVPNVRNGSKADIALLAKAPESAIVQTLKLDGTGWASQMDFYDALAAALGSFEGHGRNADAFQETMIYNLDLNTIQPPYEVVVENAPDILQPFLRKFASWIAEARQDRRDDAEWGDYVEVTVTVR